MSRYLTLFLQRRARLVLWMGDHDQSKTIAHAKFESAETGDILPDKWLDEFRKVGMVTSTLLPRVTESWIFYVSGLAMMSVGMPGRRMAGRHQRTGQLVYNIFIIT